MHDLQALGQEPASADRTRDDRARDDRLVVLAHDLANRLGVIAGYLEIAQDQVGPDSEASRSLRAVARAVAGLSEQSTRWMDLAVRATETEPSRSQVVDLVDVARHVLARADALPRRSGQDVVLEASCRPVRVIGDRLELEQLVENLVGNALKYSPGGEAVRVGVRVVGGRARLRVSDGGIGIAPQDQGHVFQPHFRTDAARASASPGTGLGLAICRRIVEQHGGTLRLRSAPGAGSQFTVVLPAAGPSR